jgi:hypothetical protein
MKEVCIVTTFGREELLYCCLKRIRDFEPNLQIEVFPDRRTILNPLVQEIVTKFGAHGHLCPDSHWYGNSRNALDSLLWAYNAGFDRVFFIEADVMAHYNLFAWYRKTFEEYQEENPFCLLGWVFNRHAPLVDCDLVQPWFYAPSFAMERPTLELVVQHATPLYFQDMPSYVRDNFKDSPLNDPQNINHWEFDGLVQRILDQEKRQTVSPGIAKCSHMGFVRSYGDEGAGRGYEELFDGRTDFMERVERIEQLIADPYERIQFFGRDIVERELGRTIPERIFRYRISLPGGWSTEFQSPLEVRKLPRRLASADIPHDAIIEPVLT